MREPVAWSRSTGVCLLAGGAVAAFVNVALPHDDNDLAMVTLVAESETWALLHAALFVAVLLLLAGLRGVLDALRPSRLEGVTEGALWVGGGLLLAAVVVAGVAMDKAADNFVAVARTPDGSGAFFQALGFDRLSYALYAASYVVLLGAGTALLGLMLRRTHSGLAAGGIVAGGLAACVGVFELVQRDMDVNLLSVLSASLVIAWVLVIGVFGVLRGRR